MITLLGLALFHV
jgi:hypothetical protein